MTVYKLLHTLTESWSNIASTCGLRHGCGSLVIIHRLKKYLGIHTSLVTTKPLFGPSLDWPNRVDGIYDVTIARHQTLRTHPQSTCLPGVHQSINRKPIRCYSLYTEITHHQHIACHDCLLSVWSSVNNQLWKFKDRLRNNPSFTSLTNRQWCVAYWSIFNII